MLSYKYLDPFDKYLLLDTELNKFMVFDPQSFRLWKIDKEVADRLIEFSENTTIDLPRELNVFRANTTFNAQNIGNEIQRKKSMIDIINFPTIVYSGAVDRFLSDFEELKLTVDFYQIIDAHRLLFIIKGRATEFKRYANRLENCLDALNSFCFEKGVDMTTSFSLKLESWDDILNWDFYPIGFEHLEFELTIEDFVALSVSINNNRGQVINYINQIKQNIPIVSVSLESTKGTSNNRVNEFMTFFNDSSVDFIYFSQEELLAYLFNRDKPLTFSDLKKNLLIILISTSLLFKGGLKLNQLRPELKKINGVFQVNVISSNDHKSDTCNSCFFKKGCTQLLILTDPDKNCILQQIILLTLLNGKKVKEIIMDSLTLGDSKSIISKIDQINRILQAVPNRVWLGTKEPGVD